MKRFDRKQAAENRQLKLKARSDQRMADSQLAATSAISETVSTSAESETLTMSAGDLADSEVAIAPSRPSLDEMWGLA